MEPSISIPPEESANGGVRVRKLVEKGYIHTLKSKTNLFLLEVINIRSQYKVKILHDKKLPRPIIICIRSDHYHPINGN